MGNADLPLQHKLSFTYLTLLQENESLPGAIGFYTQGMKLVVEGSPVLDLLRSYEAQRVRLIIRLTGLDYFGLADKVQVGIIGGMGDILAAQLAADKVIMI
jgi:hypothetical protein